MFTIHSCHGSGGVRVGTTRRGVKVFSFKLAESVIVNKTEMLYSREEFSSDTRSLKEIEYSSYIGIARRLEIFRWTFSGN